MTPVLSKKPRAGVRTERPVSSGGIIFDARGRILLLRRTDERIWGFPKGHVEKGETLRETAAREIREECGLRCTIGGKVAEIRYAYYWPPEGVNYDKRVVYFLAARAGGRIRLEDRFSDWRWAPPATALRLLHHANDKAVLRKALAAAGLSGRTRAAPRRASR